MNWSLRNLFRAVVAGCLLLGAGWLPTATVLAGGVITTGVSAPADLEVTVGQRLYPLALSRGGSEVALDTPSGAHLRSIFENLAVRARYTRPLPYSLHVLAAAGRVDAWCLPDGSVFLTTALLRRLPSLDEVAAVLAHQLAHAALRHNVDDLKSAGGRALLESLSRDGGSPSREALGRFAPALLGEFYPSSEEKAAERLAAEWLRGAGYRTDALDSLGRRLAGPYSAYLETHPRPGVHPLPVSASEPPVIIIEEASPWNSPAPPPAWTPAPPAPRSLVPPAPPLRAPRASGYGPVFSLVAGYYPLRNVREGIGSVQFTDWRGESGSWLDVEVTSLTSVAALGGLVEVPFSSEWEGVFGMGGLAGGPTMAGQPTGGGGFLFGGVLQHGVSDGIRWAMGPYAGLTMAAAPAGHLADPDPYHTDPNSPDWLEYGGEYVDWGAPVTAQAALATLGGLVTISGGTPVRGLTWFATVAGQYSVGGEWHYYAPAAYTGEEVELPWTGVNASPLSASGLMALGGLAIRF